MDALDLASDEVSSYVSRVTGEVRTLRQEELELAEEQGETEMPEWQRDAVKEAREVLDSKDWLQLPSKFDIHEWAIMDRFGGSLPPGQSAEVRNAIRRSGAFRTFKATIRRLGIEQAWFDYKRGALEQIARDWLEAHELPAAEGRASSSP